MNRIGYLRSGVLSVVLSAAGVLAIGGLFQAASPGDRSSPTPSIGPATGPTTGPEDPFNDNEASEFGDIPGASNTPTHVVSLLAGRSPYRLTTTPEGIQATTRAKVPETLWRMRSTDDWDVTFESIARPGLYLVAAKAPALSRDPRQRGHWIFASPAPLAPETVYGHLLADADPPACISLSRTGQRPRFVITRDCKPGDNGLIRIAPADGSPSLQARRE